MRAAGWSTGAWALGLIRTPTITRCRASPRRSRVSRARGTRGMMLSCCGMRKRYFTVCQNLLCRQKVPGTVVPRSSPLINGGRKFDVRYYVLIARWDPPLAFYCPGYTRQTLHPYEVRLELDEAIACTFDRRVHAQRMQKAPHRTPIRAPQALTPTRTCFERRRIVAAPPTPPPFPGVASRVTLKGPTAGVELALTNVHVQETARPDGTFAYC